MPNQTQDSPLHTIETLSTHLRLTHRQTRTLLRDYQAHCQALDVKRGTGMTITPEQLQELELGEQFQQIGFTVQQVITLSKLEQPHLWQFLGRPLRIQHMSATELNALQLILDVRRDAQRATQLLEGIMRPLAKVISSLNDGVVIPTVTLTSPRPAPAPAPFHHPNGDPFDN